MSVHERYEELRSDLEKILERLPDYINILPLTLRAFSEVRFGWNTRLQKPLPRLAPSEETATSMVHDIEESVDKSVRKKAKGISLISMIFLETVPVRAQHGVKLLPADAVLECWQAVFQPKVPPIGFEGRG